MVAFKGLNRPTSTCFVQSGLVRNKPRARGRRIHDWKCRLICALDLGPGGGGSAKEQSVWSAGFLLFNSGPSFAGLHVACHGLDRLVRLKVGVGFQTSQRPKKTETSEKPVGALLSIARWAGNPDSPLKWFGRPFLWGLLQSSSKVCFFAIF